MCDLLQFTGGMVGYVIAFILGIYVSTVGLTGVVNVLEKSIQETQQLMKDSAR